MPAGKAGPRLNEACVTFGDGYGEACADDGALPGRELDPFAGSKIEAGIAFVRSGRNDGVRPEPLDREADQATR